MIRICFGTNEKLSSKLIRWATDDPYSHTWIEYPSAVWGGYLAAHASSNGVAIVTSEMVRAAYPKHVIYEVRVNLSKGIEWARDHIGDGYDYGVFWNALLLVLYRLTKLRLLERYVWRCATKMSCSEWGTGLLKYAGTLPGLEAYEPELTTTGALRRYCGSSDGCALIGRTG